MITRWLATTPKPSNLSMCYRSAEPFHELDMRRIYLWHFHSTFVFVLGNLFFRLAPPDSIHFVTCQGHLDDCF